MSKLALLLLGASVALVVATEAAASTAPAILDHCTCTCPSKPAGSVGSIPEAAKVLKRQRRWLIGFNPKFSYSTEKQSDNSKYFEEGDTTLHSNNGGNTKIKQAKGSILGSGNEAQYFSSGTVGGSLGNLESDSAKGVTIGRK